MPRRGVIAEMIRYVLHWYTLCRKEVIPIMSGYILRLRGVIPAMIRYVLLWDALRCYTLRRREAIPMMSK